MLENRKPKVLLLEDSDSWAEDAMEVFSDRVDVVRARNVEEAFVVFDASVNEKTEFDGMYVDAIIMGRNGADDEDTTRFVEYVASTGYVGPMVTASSEDMWNNILFASGCNVPSDKESASRKLLCELGIE